MEKNYNLLPSLKSYTKKKQKSLREIFKSKQQKLYVENVNLIEKYVCSCVVSQRQAASKCVGSVGRKYLRLKMRTLLACCDRIKIHIKMSAPNCGRLFSKIINIYHIFLTLGKPKLPWSVRQWGQVCARGRRASIRKCVKQQECIEFHGLFDFKINDLC